MSENITIPAITSRNLQSFIAYASIVFGILTTQLQAIHLPALASAILGVFGVLLHPQTSITSAPTKATSPSQLPTSSAPPSA
jgi:hypothetical protein